jgi:hypothetical protein
VVEFAPSGLWTTPTDLAKLIIELQQSLEGISNKVLSKESVEFMLSAADQELPHNYIFINGIGSFIENHEGTLYFHHAGGHLGFTSAYYGSFKHGNGVVVMANSYDFYVINSIVNRVAEVYGWENYLYNNGKPLDRVEVSDKIITKYHGTYQCVDNPSNMMELTSKEEKLHAQLTGGDEWYLDFIPLSQKTFLAEGIPTTTKMIFNMNENGIIELTLTNPFKTSKWIKNEGQGK